MRRRRLVAPLGGGVNEQKFLISHKKMKPLIQAFQKCKPLLNRWNRYREIATPTRPQNEHVYEICCRPEAGDDVFSRRNVNTIEVYVVVNFEVAISSSFRDIQKICS